MCVAFWTLEHPEYALILCTNRDEFLSRPTTDASFHSFGHEAGTSRGRMLSGLDEQAGGSWFGINHASGRVALLTNITEPPQAFPSSRGYLVSSFLLSDASHSFDDVVAGLFPRDAKYAGFNLLLLAPVPPPSRESTTPDLGNAPPPPPPLHYAAQLLSNGGAGGPLTARALHPAERASGALSNGVEGKGGNEWPKITLGSRAFDAAVLQASEAPTPDSSAPAQAQEEDSALADRLLRNVLTLQAEETVTDRAGLRRTVHVAPVAVPPKDGKGEDLYATRLSTVLLIRRSGEALFVERDIWKLGSDGKAELADPSSQREFRVQVPVGAELAVAEGGTEET